MRNFFIFFICIFVLIFSSCKKRVDQNSSGSREDENKAFIRMESNFDNYDYDSLKILLYENNGSLQKISKEELTSKVFKSGTRIRIGVVLYKKGIEIFKTDDSKGEGCKFEEKTLEKGYTVVSVNICKVDLKNKEDEKDKEDNVVACKDSNEIYSSCRYLEKIESNNSFYSPAISQLSGCSDYSEIICYYKQSGKKPLVYLVCATEQDMKDGDGWFCLPQESNKIQFGFKKYSVVKIGESSIL